MRRPIDTLSPSLQASHRHAVIKEDPNTLTIEGRCPITKRSWTLTVDKKGYIAWMGGSLIQKALPGLSDEERELILSGVSSEGWNTLFGSEG